MKKGRKKFIDWQKKAHREKIFITILIIAIVTITLVLGYSVYNSFETKEETSFLNSAVILLGKEKSQLISEQENLNQTIATLTQQVSQLVADKNGLIAEKGSLTSELATLQTNYDTCSDELQTAEDDLDACLNP